MRVLIVDDDSVSRRVLKLVLERDGHKVVGQASRGDEGLRLVSSCDPNVIFLDMDMPIMEGLSVLNKLRLDYPWVPVVVLSMLNSSVYAFRAMRLGARGYLDKKDSLSLLPAILGQLVSGRMLFPRSMEANGLMLAEFSDQEIVCLRCLARGEGLTEICNALMISSAKAFKLCRRIKIKLGLDSEKGLVDHSRKMGLG